MRSRHSAIFATKGVSLFTTYTLGCEIATTVKVEILLTNDCPFQLDMHDIHVCSSTLSTILFKPVGVCRKIQMPIGLLTKEDMSI